MNTTDLKSRLMAAMDGIIKRGPGEPLVNLIEDLINTVVEQAEALAFMNRVINRHDIKSTLVDETMTSTQARLQKWVGE